jgi:hypothetical protein
LARTGRQRADHLAVEHHFPVGRVTRAVTAVAHLDDVHARHGDAQRGEAGVQVALRDPAAELDDADRVTTAVRTLGEAVDPAESTGEYDVWAAWAFMRWMCGRACGRLSKPVTPITTPSHSGRMRSSPVRCRCSTVRASSAGSGVVTMVSESACTTDLS